MRSSLSSSGDNIEIISKLGIESFSLVDIMDDQTTKFEMILDEIIEQKIVTRTYKKEHTAWLNIRLQYLGKKVL